MDSEDDFINNPKNSSARLMYLNPSLQLQLIKLHSKMNTDDSKIFTSTILLGRLSIYFYITLQVKYQNFSLIVM